MHNLHIMSPSMRREWIEIASYAKAAGTNKRSPSMRREWIEIHAAAQIPKVNIVSLHAEGVD